MKKLLVIGAMILSTFVVTGCYPQSPGNGGIVPTTTTEPNVQIQVCPPLCGTNNESNGD